MNDDAEWFAPKRYGIGVGLPISWQGWMLTLSFILFVVVAGTFIRNNVVSFISVLIILSTAFIVISARTTRGGWRWRWGERD